MVVSKAFSRFGLLVAALLSAVPAANAATDECGADMAAIIAGAYPSAQRISETGFVADGAEILLPGGEVKDGRNPVVCRVWPSYPGRLLVAVPLLTDEEDEVTTGDLELLVMDVASRKVEHRLRLRDRIVNDAVQIRSITVDTARYQIRPGEIAFGVRLTRRGASRVNPFDQVSLSLYTIDKGQLKQVVDELVVNSNTGEWDGNCAGTFDSTDRTLAMGKAGRNGYADILVTEKTTTTTAAIDDKGQCDEPDGVVTTSGARLVHDGKEYVIPETMKGF